MPILNERLKPTSPSTTTASGADHNWLERASSPIASTYVFLILILAEFFLLCLDASHKRFWYDELLTFHLSALPSLSRVFQALKAGADGMPISYYFLVRLARKLPGNSLIVLRIPSILGYLATLAGLYCFTKTKLSRIAGLGAVFLIIFSPFRAYALEARPYALIIGLLSISALLWQQISVKRFWTPLLAVTLALAVSCHHLTVLTLAVFGAAELSWSLQFRKIRWDVWAALCLATIPFFLYLPILSHYREIFGKTYWAQPNWSILVGTYQFYLGVTAAVALLFVMYFLISLLRSYSELRLPSHILPARELGFSSPELVLILGFLCYPGILFILTKVTHAGYHPRYGWPGIIGLALGAVQVFRMSWSKRNVPALLVAALVAFAYQAGDDVYKIHRDGSMKVDERWTNLANVSRAYPELPVVVGSPKAYLEAVEYSPTDLRGRLVDVVDPEIAVRLDGSDTSDKTNEFFAKYVPEDVEGLSAFLREHPTFILRSAVGNHDWFTRYLLESHYRLQMAALDPERTDPAEKSSAVYIVQRATN